MKGTKVHSLKTHTTSGILGCGEALSGRRRRKKRWARHSKDHAREEETDVVTDDRVHN